MLTSMDRTDDVINRIKSAYLQLVTSTFTYGKGLHKDAGRRLQPGIPEQGPGA